MTADLSPPVPSRITGVYRVDNPAEATLGRLGVQLSRPAEIQTLVG